MSTTWPASPSCASCWAVSSMAEKQNTPEIRFEGFTDPWEQRKLGDCFEFLKNNTLSRAGLNGENGTARNVHYGDILIKFGDCLDGERNDLPFITDDTVLPKFAGSILREGDVIFADTAEDEAAGKCVELRKLPKEPTISGLHTIPARPRFPFGTGYLGHYLNSDAYHRQLLPLMQGIKVTSVSKAALQDTQVRFPGLSEQAAIGAALSEIDTLITLHQRKYDKLCTVKKSMLDKMFPKPGETEPDIRFEGFTDPWEQRKLGEIALVTMGQSPNGACYTDNPNDAVLVQGNADLKDGWVSPRVWTTAVTKTAKAGDLIMSVRAPVGAMGKTAYDVVLGRGVAGIAGNEFLFQALSKKEAEGYWSTVSAGSTFDSINGDELRNTPVNCPRSELECETIGDCLSKVDSLITLHQ